MTIDDLVKVFLSAVASQPWSSSPGYDARRAGIRAVVTALRDEMCVCQATPERGPIHMTTEDLWLAFNEILGSSENEKAAGGVAVCGSDTAGTVENIHTVALPNSGADSPAPAAPTTDPYPEHARNHYGTPAPETCEWTQGKDGWLVTACRAQYGLSPFYYRPKGCCEFCGKPIKFKESKT